MKDLLIFGRYVGRIIEAHKQGDTQGERRFASQGEELLEGLIPVLDPDTGDTMQEAPFAEQFLSEMRSTLDGEAKAEAYLQRLIKDARDIKRKAEAYLLEVEGQKAPGRNYMQSCSEWADSTLEELGQLSRIVKARAPRKPQPEQGPGNGQLPAILTAAPTESGRKSLDIESKLSLSEKKELFNALINAGVFATSNDLAGYNKDFAAFCIFFFGDSMECATDHKLTVANNGQGRLTAFLKAIRKRTAENDPNQIAATWCRQYNGRPLNTNSMKAQSWEKYSSQLKKIVEKYF